MESRKLMDKLDRYRLARGWSMSRMSIELCIPEGRCNRNLSGTHTPRDFNVREYRVYYEANQDEIEDVLLTAATS